MTIREEDNEIVDAALDTLRWQRREIDRLTTALKHINAAWVMNHLNNPEDPFEDGYDAGLRDAAKIASAALEYRP